MTRKTFKENIAPAIKFISQKNIDEVNEQNKNIHIRSEIPPKGYKNNPAFIETKSKRLQLLIQPSLHEKLKEKAQSKDISVNELANIILKQALLED